MSTEPPEDDPYGGDPLLRDCVERALAPHAGHLPPERLEAIRDHLIVFVTTHPAAEPLYARLRRRPEVERSTLVEKMRRPGTAGAPASSPATKARRA